MEEVVKTMSKFSHLPQYCQIRLTERELINQQKQLPKQFEDLRDKWLKRIGKHWYGSHHLCWGIEHFNDASLMEYSDPARTVKLKKVISELNFVRKYIAGRGGGYYGLWTELLKYEYQSYMLLEEYELAKKTLHEIELYKKQQKRKK